MSAVPFQARIAVLADESERALYDRAVAALTELSNRIDGRRVSSGDRATSIFHAINRTLGQLHEEIRRDTELLP